MWLEKNGVAVLNLFEFEMPEGIRQDLLERYGDVVSFRPNKYGPAALPTPTQSMSAPVDLVPALIGEISVRIAARAFVAARIEAGGTIWGAGGSRCLPH